MTEQRKGGIMLPLSEEQWRQMKSWGYRVTDQGFQASEWQVEEDETQYNLSRVSAHHKVVLLSSPARDVMESVLYLILKQENEWRAGREGEMRENEEREAYRRDTGFLPGR